MFTKVKNRHVPVLKIITLKEETGITHIKSEGFSLNIAASSIMIFIKYCSIQYHDFQKI
jgi:hypothetical protein